MLRFLCHGFRRIYSCLQPRLRRRRTNIDNSSEELQGGAGAAGDGSFRSRHATTPTSTTRPRVRIATFNAALFSIGAAALPTSAADDHHQVDSRSTSRRRPRSILKQQKPPPTDHDDQEPPRSAAAASGGGVSCKQLRRRVSIDLPENEMSILMEKKMSSRRMSYKLHDCSDDHCPISLRSSSSEVDQRKRRSVVEVVREVGADVVALQNVRAEEEDGMRPLSELAEGLGMSYVFAESWAPGYGNAILSRWAIRSSTVHKICDDSDFRNVLKTSIEVPNYKRSSSNSDDGDDDKVVLLNLHCTHLDHLDERWRMKQMEAILQVSDGPHLLVGGLNSLDATDYSTGRWNDIVKYYEEMGKPKPEGDVMRLLKGKQYLDAKDFAGDCQAVVVAAKGQDVQGTCKYGTRVDYILSSPNSPYEFVDGSYGVVSSKGTSDHHIVKVDITIN